MNIDTAFYILNSFDQQSTVKRINARTAAARWEDHA